jgi:Ras-related protein Rab-11A
MDKLTEEYDMAFKILLLGDSGVGKSSLLLRYTKNQFMTDMRSTIGVEFGVKFIKVDNLQLKVQIWDTAGMERYRSLTSAYYKGAKGVIIVYDICRKKSFENIDKWIDDFKSKADEDAVILLIGNKSDLKDKREVNTDEAASKSEKNKLAFLETSAKNNDNVHKAFLTLFNEIIKIYKEKNSDMISDIEESKKKGYGGYIKSKSGSIKGLSGGYTIQMDVMEDNILENDEFEEKKCC